MSVSGSKANIPNLERHITSRQARVLACFDELPDSVLIDFQVASIVMDRSLASLWRDVKAGVLPQPTYVGRKSPRLQIGTVRARMKGACYVG